MSDLTIWLVDDDQAMLDTLEFRLEPLGYEIRKYSSIAAGKDALVSCVGSILIVLDHDFSGVKGITENGYDFADFAKKHCWMKWVTPIIYLTGRESYENFYDPARRLEFGGYAPDDFMSKAQLADKNMLEDKIGFWADRIFNFNVSIDEVGLERALEIYTDPQPM